MIAHILAIIGGLFQVAGKLFDWLYARNMADAGRTAEQLQRLKDQVHAAQKAVEIRIDFERNLNSDPDRVRDDDGFKRPDSE